MKLSTQGSKVRIYRFFGEVFLWLIICFIAWFLSARILNIPLVWLADFILSWLSDGIFTNVYLNFSEGEFKLINQQLVLNTNIPPPGELPVFVPTRPLIYGYGFAAFTALTIATPKEERKKWREIGIAYVVFLFVQLFGVSCEALMALVYNSTPEISGYFPLVAAHLDVLGLSYQVATLVLPPVTPLVLWIMFNTAFMEQLVGRKLSAK